MTICVDRVSFAYDKQHVLEDISLSIDAGEFVGVFGPNGGGKTTFLKLLMGFIEPNSGSILLEGKSPKQSRRKIGYVPQVSKMDKQFPITVEEVVQMGCLSSVNRWGVLPSSYRKKVIEALEKVRMSHKRLIPFGYLSGGEAQRVLIARALVGDPAFLFLDEPTASVDPQAEQDILLLLSEFKGLITQIMVTHDLQAIMQTVGKLICVHREAHVLDPSEVCEHYGLGLYHSPLIKTMGPKKYD